MARTQAERIVCWVERGLIAVGTVCLSCVGAVSMQTMTYQAEEGAWLAGASGELPVATGVLAAAAPHPLPIGRLEIPRVGLSVVVAEGDDERTLQVAAGHLPETPLPWQPGNAAVAGHRDTFFRPLRRVQRGDEIRLDTAHGTFRYRVTGQRIVEPNEVWVLNPSPAAALTLITCYPFNFIGPAPRRFVVHAERIADAGGAQLEQRGDHQVHRLDQDRPRPGPGPPKPVRSSGWRE